MSVPELKLIRKIAENQQWRSTWLAECDGIQCLAKVIETETADKARSLVHSLRKQIHFSRILSDADRHSICLFREMIESDRRIAFIRDWIDGTPLDDVLKNRTLLWQEAVKYMLPIARIVAQAHHYGVVHGDLKPANIILDAGEASIIDWDTMSINEAIDGLRDGMTLSLDQVSGPVQYMPPEQCRGERLDARCDIYALGVILYQMLVGETPFAGIPAKNLLTVKQERGIDSIAVTHPELALPPDLSRLIDDSLKSDCNQRLALADDFVEKLEYLVTPTHSATAVSQPPPIRTAAESSGTENEYKLALIGHPGAGKTVLAAGLYAISDENFIVEAADEATKTHVVNTRSMLEMHHWPMPTSKGEVVTLRFWIHHNRHKMEIAFDEYAGERINSVNFHRETLCARDGVLLLLNPGAPQLREPLQRNKILGDIKSSISYLCSLSHCPPIALVITASDRLQADLKEFASEFESYVAEIVRLLKANKCCWKRFDISVSGKLEDQSKPSLAQHNNACDPFGWLLKNFNSRNKVSSVRKGGKIAVGIILLLFLLVAGRIGWEWRKLARWQENLNDVQEEFQTASGEAKLYERVLAMAEMRMALCSGRHIGVTGGNAGNRLGECGSACTPLFLLPANRSAYEEFMIALESAIDDANDAYRIRRFEYAVQSDSKKDIDDAAELINTWLPMSESGEKRKDDLLARCSRELPLARERQETRALRRKLQSVIGNPGNGFPVELQKEAAVWLLRPSVLSQEERDLNKSEMEELRQEARNAVIAEIIREMDKSDASAAEFAVWVRQYNELAAMPPRQKKDSLQKVVRTYVERRCRDYRVSLLKSKTESSPDFIQDIESKIYPLLENGFVIELKELINAEMVVARVEWQKQQQKVVADFIHNLIGMDAIEALGSLKMFCAEESGNPCLAEAETAVFKIANDEFWRQLDDFPHSHKNYLDLKEFCAAVRTTTSNYIKAQKLFSFAVAYMKWMENPGLKIKLEKIEGFSTYDKTIPGVIYNSHEDGAYIYNSCLVIVEDYVSESRSRREIILIENNDKDENIFRKKWQLLPISRQEFVCAPWDLWEITLEPYINIRRGRDRQESQCFVAFETGKSVITYGREDNGREDKEHSIERSDAGYVEVKFDQIKLRIYYTVEGRNLDDLLRTAGLR